MLLVVCSVPDTKDKLGFSVTESKSLIGTLFCIVYGDCNWLVKYQVHNYSQINYV